MGNTVKKHAGFGQGILVPVDFSAVAENALIHSMELAQLHQWRVCLLHVYCPQPDSGIAEEELALRNINQDLLSYQQKYEQKYAVKISLLVRKGNLFKVVNAVVGELKPKLMIMGTHGKQGLQHLFGSHALRVVLDSPCPVMVVQERRAENGYRRILLPVNSETAPVQLMEWIMMLCKVDGLEILLFQAAGTNAESHKLTSGIVAQIVAGLDDHQFACMVKIAESPKDFSTQVIDAATSSISDLIITMTMPAADGSGYNFSDWNERLMFNHDQVPVMFINRAENTNGQNV